MPHQCLECPASYNKRASLYGHISRKHPDLVKLNKTNRELYKTNSQNFILKNNTNSTIEKNSLKNNTNNTTENNPLKNTKSSSTENTSLKENSKYTSNVSLIKNSSISEQSKFQLMSLEMNCLEEDLTSRTILALACEIDESDMEGLFKKLLNEKLQKYALQPQKFSRSISRNVKNENNVNKVSNIMNANVNNLVNGNLIINTDEKQNELSFDSCQEPDCWNIYVLITREYKNSNKSIYKVGVTSRGIKKRFSEYPPLSDLKYNESCDENLEDKVLVNMKRKFKLVQGREWFEGPLMDIIDVVKATTTFYKIHKGVS